MGWDEARLRSQSEVIRQEAREMGDLLRSLGEEDDTRRLIREAEAALGRTAEKTDDKESDQGGARDNLMGADMGEGEGARRMVESGQPQQPIEDAPEQRARTIEEAMELEPVGIDLRPVMVVERELVQLDEDADAEWRRAARGGPGRLV